MKITLTRKMHYNTGSFSNVEVNVGLETEVEDSKVEEGYNNLALVADSIMALETIALMDEMHTANTANNKDYQKSFGNYVTALNENKEEIIKGLKNAAAMLK